MKVDDEGTVILLALLLAGVGNHLLVLVHLLLQSLGIDDQRTGYLAVLHDGEEIGLESRRNHSPRRDGACRTSLGPGGTGHP